MEKRKSEANEEKGDHGRRSKSLRGLVQNRLGVRTRGGLTTVRPRRFSDRIRNADRRVQNSGMVDIVDIEDDDVASKEGVFGSYNTESHSNDNVQDQVSIQSKSNESGSRYSFDIEFLKDMEDGLSAHDIVNNWEQRHKRRKMDAARMLEVSDGEVNSSLPNEDLPNEDLPNEDLPIEDLPTEDLCNEEVYNEEVYNEEVVEDEVQMPIHMGEEDSSDGEGSSDDEELVEARKNKQGLKQTSVDILNHLELDGDNIQHVGSSMGNRRNRDDDNLPMGKTHSSEIESEYDTTDKEYSS